MEAVPQNNNEQVEKKESLEYSESVERAKEVYAELKAFEGTDIVGREALAQVEALACALTAELHGLPEDVCLKEGLPLPRRNQVAS